MPANGKLHFSLYELVELLGWSKSGKSGGKVYRDVRDSLERIGATRIKSENAFYSKERDSYISDSFNIWRPRLFAPFYRFVERSSVRRVMSSSCSQPSPVKHSNSAIK
jgi:hypothetical protein